MKTKKLIVASLVLISAAFTTSCKKSYGCECKTTYTDGNGDLITLTQTKAIDEKMKEKQATASCTESEAQMTYVNNDLNADPTGSYEDIKTTCILK
jgi:hypothetical protein